MSRATNELASIPFGSLIGGPLTAAVEAQAIAAQTSMDFIQSVGFVKDSVSGESKVRTVDFSYERAKEGGTENELETVKLNIPILTIVPIPYLRIDTLDVDFTANISASSTNSSSSNSSTNFGANASASYGFGPYKARFSASYSSKKSSSSSRDSRYSVEYNMNVNLHAVQDDMPAGMAKILNLLEDSISAPTPTP